MAAKLNIDYLAQTYFYFDEPVPYKVVDDKEIMITPINVRESGLFLMCCDILNQDKDSAPSVEIIQMSYLEFILKVLLKDEANKFKFQTLLFLCLGLSKVGYAYDEKKKPFLFDVEKQIKITHKQFNDIRRIILYQNISDFSEQYISPDMKKAIAETNAFKNKDIEMPTTERKMAIITAHTGISKKEQMDMTFRSHELLFKEVVGEVEFSTSRTAVLFSKEAKNSSHWIYPKKKDKMQGYVTEIGELHSKLGGEGKMPSNTTTNMGSSYDKMFNDFINK